jgi:acetylornithine deacetylase/succinyl-diaminopimelate desuccinylase-like protein
VVSSEGANVTVTVVGDRPGGRIASDHPLVETILASYKKVGVLGTLLAGSTDANIPLSLGIPAASMGVSKGGAIHTLNEFLDPDTLPLGAEALLLTIVALQKRLRS